MFFERHTHFLPAVASLVHPTQAENKLNISPSSDKLRGIKFFCRLAII